MSSAATKAADASFVLANGLVLAEFDIDKGACVRTYYPKSTSLGAGGVRRRPIGVNVPGQAEYFANHMLPDGAEKLTVGRTIFVVNRPRPSVCARFAAYAFLPDEASGQWRRPSVSANAAVSDIVKLDMKAATLTVRFKDEVIVDALPVTEGSVAPASPTPPEVVAVSSNLASASAAARAMPPPPSPEQPNAGLSAPGEGSGGGGSKMCFLVVRSDESRGRPLGLLMTRAQQEAFLAAVAKVLAPPTPEPERLFASEEEPPHPVTSPPPEGEGGTSETGEGYTAVGEGPAIAVAPPDTASGAEGGEVHMDPTSAAPGGDDLEAAQAAPAVQGSPDALLSAPAPPPAVPIQLSPLQPAKLPPVTAVTAASVASNSPSSAVSSPTVRLGGAEENDGEILYGLCAVVSKRDTSARRGGRTKAVALLGPSLGWLEPFFPILVEAAQYCCDIPGHDADAVQQQSKVLKLCYEAINGAAPAVAAGMAKTSRLLTEVARYSTLSGTQEVSVTYHTAPFGTTHKTRIPLAPTSHDIAFNRYSLEGLIEALGPSFLHLVKAIMTEKRVIVLSRMGLSTDVAEAAIALGTLGNLLDPHFIAEKVFPYTSVNSVEHFLAIPGYIIGTLNPIFENEKVWHWDVLCDLDKKTVVLGERESGFPGSGGGSGSGNISKRQLISESVGGMVSSLSFGSNAHGGGAAGSAMTDLEAASPLTAQFFKDLASSIYCMRALRIPQGERNRRLRLTLEEFMQTAVMVTYTQDHPDVQTSQVALKEHFMNPVLNTLRAQCRLTSMMDDVRSNVLFPGESPLLLLYTASLRRVKGLETAGVVGLLNAVAGLLSTDAQVRLFLRRMTVAVGGLGPLGMQLTHPSQAVRTAAYGVLARVDQTAEGKAAIAAMHGFHIFVYEDFTKRCPLAGTKQRE